MSTEWHGWSIERDGKTVAQYHVGRLPGRKSVCLYRMDGSVLQTVAFFREEAEAVRFLAFLDQLAG